MSNFVVISTLKEHAMYLKTKITTHTGPSGPRVSPSFYSSSRLSNTLFMQLQVDQKMSFLEIQL